MITPAPPQPSLIRLFLPDGSSEGLRLVEKAGWIGCAAMFSRGRFPELRTRPELKRTGVYLLLGDEPGDRRPRLYIGEGDPVLNRLLEHFRKKDFWSTAIVFTSRDGALHKAHLQNLEASLIRLAAVAKRCQLMNANMPEEPSLSEIDQAETRLFLAQLLSVLSVLGIDIFQQPAAALPGSAMYHLDAKGLHSEGYETDAGFVVRSGSQSPNLEAPSCAAPIISVRADLQQQRILIAGGDRLILNQDYLFSSPSQAAAVILGRAANGRVEWKTADGRSLKQMQESALERELA